MRFLYYILEGHLPVGETDGRAWAEWFDWASEQGLRRVAWDQFGEHALSTVFVGIDHNFAPDGPPLLFETMLFPEGEVIDRYTTWDQAEIGHRAALLLLTSGVHV